MAGLWDEWVDKQEKRWLTYTVITTDPSNQINHIHNRMPAILDKLEMDLWINFDCPPNEALTCLKPYEKLLELYPVSTFVNSPANNSKQCILPIENLNTLTMF
jgi:putative SOS response-associated peptidase YedK